MKKKTWYFLRSFAVGVFFSVLLMQLMFFALGFDLWKLTEPIFLIVIIALSLPMYVIVRKKLFAEIELKSKASYYKEIERDK